MPEAPACVCGTAAPCRSIAATAMSRSAKTAGLEARCARRRSMAQQYSTRSGTALRRQRLHLPQHALEYGAPGLKVGVEKELGDTGIGVAADVVANLVRRAPQHAAPGSGRGGCEVEGAPTH